MKCKTCKKHVMRLNKGICLSCKSKDVKKNEKQDDDDFLKSRRRRCITSAIINM